MSVNPCVAGLGQLMVWGRYGGSELILLEVPVCPPGLLPKILHPKRPRGTLFRSRFPCLAWCWAAQPALTFSPLLRAGSLRVRAGLHLPPGLPPEPPSAPCSSPAALHLGIWQSLPTASAPNVNVSPFQPALSRTSCFSESCPSCRRQWPKPKPHLTVHFSSRPPQAGVVKPRCL